MHICVAGATELKSKTGWAFWVHSNSDYSVISVILIYELTAIPA